MLGDLLIRMGLDMADMRSDMNRAMNDVRRFGKGIESTMTSAKTAVKALVGAFVVDQFRQSLTNTLNLAEGMNKLSQKTGITSEALSSLRASAKLADLEQSQFDTGMKKLAVNMAAAAGGGRDQALAFKTLGVNVESSKGKLKGTDEVLAEIADKFESMEDGPAKVAMAVALFGKAGEAMIPFLNSLRTTQDEAQRLGVIIGTDFAIAAEKFNDDMKRMELLGEGFKIRVSSVIIDGLNAIAEEFIRTATEGNRMKAVVQSVLQLIGLMSTEGKYAADTIEREINNINTLTNQLAEVQAQRITGERAGENVQWIRSWETEIKGKIAASERIVRDLLGTTSAFQSTPPPGPRTRGPIIPKDDAQKAALEAAERRKYEGASRALAKELIKLRFAQDYVTDGLEMATLQYELQEGALHDLIPTHKAALVKMAEEVDVIRRAIRVREQAEEQRKVTLVGIEAEGRAYDEHTRAIRESAAATQDAANDAAFEASMLGKAAIEMERLRRNREIDLEVRRKIQALGSDDMFDAARVEAMLRIRAEGEEQKKIAEGVATAKLEHERSWQEGARKYMEQYVLDATNSAKNTERIFATVFSGLEDAIVEFAKTGKINFRSFAESVIVDLIRIETRAKLASAWQGMGGLSGIWSMLGTSGADAVMGNAMNMTAGDALINAAALGMADGGAIGANQMRLVGERGPELFMPSVAGQIIPNSELGGGASNGPVFNVDLRGADVAAVARLEAYVRSLDGSLEHRAVAAAMNARTRGVRI